MPKNVPIEDRCIYRQQGVECHAEEHDTEWCKYFCGWNPKVEHELIEADRKRHEKWLRGSTGV